MYDFCPQGHFIAIQTAKINKNVILCKKIIQKKFVKSLFVFTFAIDEYNGIMDTAKLTKIIIKGYKSISSASPITLDLNGIDVLLGANGAGKSNIISFFQMLVNMMKGGFQKYVAESGSNKFFLHYGAKQTSEINAELWFGNLKYSFALANAVNERLIITNEEIATGSRKAKRLVSDFQESALS